ncbi:TetR-like C-terminal domain-containing protein [Streptomyces sp. ACA25]|uniref:TetR-like C-terminal domain-containing protein n=1 Tax=Streptomyces sp. ACA25 TaxID=3022596 RepID=UPI002307BCE5|nr:TetR-like C-terminal domain-containing protein [Streptomyces sp. ACA25]MDB1087593.1 TetR-like C-terminal domain-containing protein [Streptomyces sp. ACA25]
MFGSHARNGTAIDAVAAAQRCGAMAADRSAVVAARSVWATVHGLATLHPSGGPAKLGLDDTPERLATETLGTLLRLPPPASPGDVTGTPDPH